MKAATVHYRDLRLLVNAGMAFPACFAMAEKLDLDRGRLATSPDPHKVTCKRCRARMRPRKASH